MTHPELFSSLLEATVNAYEPRIATVARAMVRAEGEEVERLNEEMSRIAAERALAVVDLRLRWPWN
jgi:predicted component of type VI protein secretion system